MHKTTPTLAIASLLAVGCGGSNEDPSPDEVLSDIGSPAVESPDVASPGVASPGVEPGPDALPADDAGTTSVDCAGALPCAGAGAEGSLSLVLTAAQGEQADGSGDFRLDFALAAVRGGDVGVLGTSTLAAGETRLDTALVTLGGQGSGFGDAASASLEAATAIPASIEFIGSLPDGVTIIDTVTIDLLDGDRAASVRFANVPAGSSDEPVDCASTLPCAWTSPDGTVSVGVDSIGVRLDGDREGLAVTYEVSSTRTPTVAAEGYTRARGADGETFVQSALEFGGATSRFGARLLAMPAPGTPVRARVELDGENDSVSIPLGDVLDTLRLGLFEVAEPRVPYWNPVFANLPVGE